MKAKGHLLFAFMCGVLVVGVAVIVIFVAVSSAVVPVVFPVYVYREYIDRTDTMIFTADGGAQLYEAEQGELSGGAYAEDNAMASGGKNAGGMQYGAVISWRIAVDEDCAAQIVMSVCYMSPAGRDTEARNLFSLCLNGVELGARGANISHGENRFDFKENILCSVEFSAGENTIEIVSVAEGYTVDYMALVSERERTSQEAAVGVPSYAFSSKGDRQRFEAEYAEKTNVLPVYDSSVSCGYYVRNARENACVVFYPESDAACASMLSVSLRSRSQAGSMSDFCAIYVNGTRMSLNAGISGEEAFVEIVLGEVELVRGVNEIAIVNTGGDYDLDYIVLNADVSYSAEKIALRYEAEDAELFGGCRTEANSGASGGYNVGDNVADTSISFTVRSRVDAVSQLFLRLSYWGEEALLGAVLSVTVNGQPVVLSGIEVPMTGGYENYTNVFLGAVSVQAGDNVIAVKSLTGAYNLDYIELVNASYSVGGGDVVFEAEDAVLTGGCQAEWNEEASGGKNVGFNVPGSSVNFSFVSDGDASVGIVLSLSGMGGEDTPMSDCLTITVNGQEMDLYGVFLPSTGAWTIFTENEAGSVTLQAGLNTISVTSKSEIYNIDYIGLVARA